jgi:predicted RecA/RadA family phage recombinase
MVGMASFRHGDPVFVDYTPVAQVNAGDVVITNDTPRVAHRDIAPNELGALAAVGGVYEMVCDVATPADKKVYWDPVNKWVSATAGTLKVFGVTTTATTGAAQLMYVRHDPAA